jgi:O-antigen/teichoic acid export membrane protein
MLAQIIAAPVGLIIARAAGAVHYGQYFAAFALVGSFSGLFLLGVDVIISREIAVNRSLAPQLLASTFVAVVGWSPIVIAIVVAAAMILGYSREVRDLLWFIAATGALLCWLRLIRAAFCGLGRMKWDAASRLLEGCMLLASVAIVACLRGSILAIAVAILLANVVTLLGTGFLVHRSVGIRFTFDTMRVWDLVRTSLSVGIAGLVTSMYLRLDTVLLAVFRSEREVGLYTAAFNLAMWWFPISASLAAATTPQLSPLFRGDDIRALQSFLDKGLRYTLAVALAAGVVTSLASVELMPLLYGPEFAEASPALAILGAVIAINFVNAYLSSVLVAGNRQGVLLYLALGGLAAMIVCSVLLTRPLGLVGTAISVLIRECVGLCLLVFYVSRYVKWGRLSGSMLSPFVAAGASAAMFFALKPAVSSVLLVPACGVGYLAVFAATGGRDLLAAEMSRLVAAVRHARFINVPGHPVERIEK